MFKVRISSWNVGTMRGKSNEVVETLARRKVDICCAQETRWKGGSARTIQGKDSKYKFYWSGDESGYGGVGFLLAEEWINKVISVVRLNHRLMIMRLLMGEVILNIFNVYAPQSGLAESEKDAFFVKLQSNINSVPDTEFLIICGDFNGHVGRGANGFEGYHGGYGFGERNGEGIRILDTCVTADLAITTPKSEIHSSSPINLEVQKHQLITYLSSAII